MIKKQIAILLTLVTSGIFASCNSTSTSSNNNTNSGSGMPPANTMYVTVGGKTDTFAAVTNKVTSSGTTSITVIGNNTAMNGGCGFVLENISSPGTFNVGTVSSAGGTVTGVPQMDYLYTDASGNLIQYEIPANNTSSVGSMTITGISATSIQATFSNCTLTLISGNGPQTVLITNGAVNANIN